MEKRTTIGAVRQILSRSHSAASVVGGANAKSDRLRWKKP